MGGEVWGGMGRKGGSKDNVASSYEAAHVGFRELLVAGDCLFDSVNTTDQSCFLSIGEEKVQVEFKQ